MVKLRSFQSLAAAALLACIHAAPAIALESVTFVTGTGSDASACTRAAPCKKKIFSFGNNAIGGNAASDAPTLLQQQ